MKSEIKRGRPISFLVKMANKTNLHLYEKPNKCLDCGGKLAFNGQSDFNIHVVCERCEARFYYDKELGR